MSKWNQTDVADPVSRNPLRPVPVQWLDVEPLYRVECLLEHMVAKRGCKRFYRFLVKWDGYEEEHNTWGPVWNLLGCDDLESRSIKLRD